MKIKRIEILNERDRQFLLKIKNREIDGFYPTGSHVFGVADNNSDFDFVVTEERWTEICKNKLRIDLDIDYNKDIDSSNSGGLIVLCNNYKFNFIIVPTIQEYKIWIYSTRAILSLIESNRRIKEIIENKKKRVELFEFFCAYFRDYFEENK